MAEVNTAKQYLTKDDLMALLGIKSDKALRLLKSDYLDSVKVGNQYVTTNAWLSAMFEANKNGEIVI